MVLLIRLTFQHEGDSRVLFDRLCDQTKSISVIEPTSRDPDDKPLIYYSFIINDTSTTLGYCLIATKPRVQRKFNFIQTMSLTASS